MAPIYTWIRHNILGLVAIFIALSGTAVATQVASDSVRTAKKVKRGPAGPQGPAGAQGPQGAQGLVGPVTGSAGGDLTGNYPNPVIAPGKVGAAKLADFSIGPIKYATNTPSARVTNSANEAIADSTPTVLSFDSERYDYNNMHDNTLDNSRLVATSGSGTTQPYLVTATVQFAANATGTRSVTLRRDGTTDVATDTRSAVSGSPTSITISTATAVGDSGHYFEVVVNQTSGGSLNVVKSDEVSPEFALNILPGAAD